MKIGIDGRICDDWGYYGEYACHLIEAFCEKYRDCEIIVYRDKKALISGKLTELPHTIQKNISYKRDSILPDSRAKKLFEKEKFALMIFFDHHVPKGYSWDFYVMVENLKEIFFPKKKWLHRKIYALKLTRAIAKAKKVMVLDWGTALELNERLNIKEDLITKVPGFFPELHTPDIPEIKIDIKVKHNIRWEYLIYDSGNEIHNNFERILKTIKKLKDTGTIVYIIILCDATTKDIDIRNTALSLWITQQILFLWAVSSDIESSYYTQSKWVIFSSIYESFPFHFAKAIHYKTPIFANDIPANKDVMWTTIHYLDPLSIHNMADTISENISCNTVSNYGDIRHAYNPISSATRLGSVITTKN